LPKPDCFGAAKSRAAGGVLNNKMAIRQNAAGALLSSGCAPKIPP
jgi:hypothetical protein